MASPTGGYEHEFVQEPPKNLQCPVCLQVLREPHITSCCGHHFCHSCIARIQSNNKPCPLCKERGFTTFPNKAVAREVNALKVYCPLKSRGCDWQGELGRVEQHLNPGAGGCGFVLVHCKYKCGQRFERQTIAKHEFEECPKRPMEVQMAFLMSIMNTQAEQIAAQAKKITSLENENASKQAKIQALEQQVTTLKENALPSGLPTPPYYFSLMNYEHYKKNNLVIYSPPFYSHPGGYKMIIQMQPGGSTTAKGTHLSLFISVRKGEFDEQLKWPFRGRVTVELYNFKEQEWSYRRIIRFEECARAIDQNMSPGGNSGSYKYITNEQLQDEYLRDNYLVRFKIVEVAIQ